MEPRINRLGGKTMTIQPRHRQLLPWLVFTTLLTNPATASECTQPIEREPTAAPVYVILYGYPHAPANVGPSLKKVDEDVLLMDALFAALGPRRVFAHGEPEPNLVARFGDDLRAPSWRALKRTVDDLTPLLAEHDTPPQVYLYFAGHGDTGSGPTNVPRGVLFGRAEPGADAPGYNGRLDSALIAREVLTPLSAHADVHFIADTCLSFYLLSTRGRGPILTRRVRKRPPPVPLVEPFAAEFTRVGASLASHGITFEHHELGGLFSHAIRTAALGIADLNGDGLITYREFRYTLWWMLANAEPRSEPVILSPGLDTERVFIDWRGSPAARVCLPTSITGTQVIDTPHGPLASLPLHPQRPSAIWLTPGNEYTLDGDGQRLTLTARNGLLDLNAVEIGRGRSTAARVTYAPIEVTTAPELPPMPAFEPNWYFGIGATGGGTRFQGDDLPPEWTPAGVLSGRLGRGDHRLAAELGYTRWSIDEETEGIYGPNRIKRDVHLISGRLGYDHLLVSNLWEFSLGVFAGGVQQIDGRGTRWIPEAAVRAVLLLPVPWATIFAARLDARASMVPTAEDIGMLFQVGLGFDFEWGLD